MNSDLSTMTVLFFSSNGNDNDQLKSGPQWSDKWGAPQGVAGYFIDLAVQHPEIPGRFVLGIECDGATYHSAKSARDRDKTRQEALEDLGWKIHRIWSTDWFQHTDRELKRLLASLPPAR